MKRRVLRWLDGVIYAWMFGKQERSCPDCPHPTDDPANLPRTGE